MDLTILLAVLGGWWGIGALWMMSRHGGVLRAAWVEPMLRVPILLIESDDWGPPGKAQILALGRLAEVLSRERDRQGRSAQMTLALVLAAPRKGKPPAEWGQREAVDTLADISWSGFGKVLAEYADCFSPQLHGWMHCWPQAVAKAAEEDPCCLESAMRVAEEGFQVLPSPLQSRWADCAHLPCQRIRGDGARVEAIREATFFLEHVPGATPVVVPPTFVWNEDVEAGWAAGGLRVLIAPRERQETRGIDGRPSGTGQRCWNGQHRRSGLRTLVRDIYFEPALGHQPQKVMQQIRARWREGRPALLETHRFNFEGDAAESSLAALEEMLQMARGEAPTVEFLRPLQILECLGDPGYLYRGRARLRIWVRRLWGEWYLRRIMWLTGFIVWLWIAWFLSIGSGTEDDK